jgi:hypothetical protein
MKPIGFVVRVFDFTSEPTITMGWYYQRQDFETGQDEEGMIEELPNAYVFEDASDAQEAASRLLEWFPDASCDINTEVLLVGDLDSFDPEDEPYADRLVVHCPICGELHCLSEITTTGFIACPRCHEQYDSNPDGVHLLMRINAAIKDLHAIIVGDTHELDITIKIGTEAYNFYDAPPLVEGLHKALVDWRDDELCR